MSAKALSHIDMRRLGRELKKARNQRGMTQEEASGVIDVGRTTMVAIEKGERRVSEDELIKLANAYGRNVSDLVRPRPEIGDFQVEYRGPSQGVDYDEETLQEYRNEFEELCRDYLELENLTGSPMERNYPSEYQVDRLSADRAAEEVARRERNRLGLGSGPLGDFRTILEEKVGIRIFYIEMRPSAFSEMYYYDDEVGGCIAVNSLHPPERQLWSLCHGYIHFLVHRYQPAAYVEAGRYERLPKRERLADLGALHLTMPASEVQERFNKILRTKEYPTPADLCILADYFGVSVAAMTRRLENMERLPTGTWNKLKDRGIEVRKIQEKLGLRLEKNANQKLPRRYQYLAVEALDEGKITEGRFARLLRVNRLQARTLAERLRGRAGDITEEDLIDLDLGQSLERSGQ
jgi:Zn-dependent peptidase ImmA (M78 family)/DNA-binding XRE family transcriptional regulator